MSGPLGEQLSAIRDQQLQLLLRGDLDGGAVVVARPMTLKRMLQTASPDYQHNFSKGSKGSGWTVFGMPIYRSHDIPGPCVLSARAVEALGDLIF